MPTPNLYFVHRGVIFIFGPADNFYFFSGNAVNSLTEKVAAR
jgi:hypothetical protein